MLATPIVLPSVDDCVVKHALTFALLGHDWIDATVRVNGHAVKHVRHPTGTIRVTKLPDGRFTFAVRARGHGGRRVTASKTYAPCLKPVVTIPPGDPPQTLVVTDLVLGSGPVAAKGDAVKVHYVGFAWSTRKQIDASYDRGQAFEFPLGQGQVIEGFDRGVTGMRVGGRRQIVIPPDLGYGAEGSPPAVAPNETLVFVIDLVRVHHG
jgi:peptidylprolyl isomerase